MVQTPVIHFITDIFFYDSLFGWAVHGNGGILKTTNSGFNWSHTQIVNPGIGPLIGVYFLNRDTGWICGIAAYIRKTTNNGINWIVQDYPPFGGLPKYRSVMFMNYNIGYITGGGSGGRGYIIKTTNSGQNWQQLYLSDSINTELYGQYWFKNNTGWFYGLNTFLKTTNGGNNFINYYPNIPPTTNGANGLLGLYFINEQTGWLSGGNLEQKNMYKTTNAGINWVFQDNPVAQFQFAQLNDVIFINENTGWAGSYAGQIITTTNGGINWITDFTAQSEFICFSKYNSSKIWCGAPDGQVWYLDNMSPIGIQQTGNEIPKEFKLKQNYPNPFNTQTVIEFDVSKKQNVVIKIYDLLGRKLEIIANQIFETGTYKINYNANRLTSGVYFYTMETSNYKEVRKFVLVK